MLAAGALIDVSDIPGDSGWLTLPLQTGVTGQAGNVPVYRLKAGIVWLGGRSTFDDGVNNQRQIGTLPVGFRPIVDPTEMGVMYTASGGWSRVWVTATGQVWSSASNGSATTIRNLAGGFIQGA